MPKPNITMFFPAYNEEENMPKLLNSAIKVLSESANDYEIMVIVYEGSTDGTIEVVKKLIKKNKKIKLLLQPKDKKGIGYAKMMGFKNAKYPYIFYADSDNQFDLSEFKKLKAKFVAVRSSATAEYSSQASWAGELETFLNTTDKTISPVSIAISVPEPRAIPKSA